MKLELPRRHQDSRSMLTDMQKTFLDMMILKIGEPKLVFRLLFYSGKSQSVSNSLLNTFLNDSDALEYMRIRRRQLEVFFNGDVSADDQKEESDMSLEDIQRNLVKNATQKLYDEMQNGEVDFKSAAVIEKLLNKALDIDAEKIEAPEPPRRYLPEDCYNCKYRRAIEEGNCDIPCERCRYKTTCLEKGVEFSLKEEIESWEDEQKNS